jgi:4-diphosphocytidyl-2-C-methyl-D-erythritol kinase
MIFKAPAKINLGLEVLRKRADGFHDINTVFARILLSDEISITPSEHLSCQSDPSLGIPQESNLAYRVADLLRKKYSIASGAEIFIKKNIPSGGGLGGGSSDAATVLNALNSLWAINAPTSELSSIALEIGSDVPFFLEPGTAAVALGRGEQLSYFDYELKQKILLVFPDVQIPTQWAYESLNMGTTHKPATNFKSIILQSETDPLALRSGLTNDFEPVVFSKHPEIARIKEKLYTMGAIFASMSGSGSTVYGLFDNSDSIKIALDSLNNYRTFHC